MKAVLLKAEKTSFNTKDGSVIKGENLFFLDIEKVQLWKKFVTADKLKEFDTASFITDFLTNKVFLLAVDVDVVQGYDGREKMRIAGISAVSKGR